MSLWEKSCIFFYICHHIRSQCSIPLISRCGLLITTLLVLHQTPTARVTLTVCRAVANAFHLCLTSPQQSGCCSQRLLYSPSFARVLGRAERQKKGRPEPPEIAICPTERRVLRLRSPRLSFKIRKNL